MLTALTTVFCVGLAFWFAVPFDGKPQAGSFPEPLFQSAFVELNTAGVDALCTLPGIGEALAWDILDYRLEHGPFQSLEEVTAIPGITSETVDSWQGLAYIR